jgi:Leucine-rich repeat (LRR) protein
MPNFASAKWESITNFDALFKTSRSPCALRLILIRPHKYFRDLRGNKIAEIKREVLEPLKNLTALHLQNNQIRYIVDTTFPPSRLRVLSLMENKIESLDQGAFAMMPSLRHLYLSNNRLVHLKNGTFFNLTRLLMLTLDDNFIKTIEYGVFTDIPNLITLKLERNQFRTLDKRVLRPLRNLKNM